jgi:hypothetical protein
VNISVLDDEGESNADHAVSLMQAIDDGLSRCHGATPTTGRPWYHHEFSAGLGWGLITKPAANPHIKACAIGPIFASLHR